MDPKTLASQLVNSRLDQLRELARGQLAARHKPPQAPVVNVAAPPAQVTVNVPETPAPKITVQPAPVSVAAPVVKVEPRIEIAAPAPGDRPAGP